MKNKSLLLSIFLILAVILSSSAVFAEDTADASLQQADDVDTIQEAIVQDEKLSAEYTVAAGSTGEQIQAQLDSMSDGDVLNLEDGTYTDVCIYVNKSITINGNGAKLVGFDNPSINTTPSIITNTSANGGYGIGNLATLYVVKANNVTINGLTIVAGANSSSETAGPSYSNALVYVESSNNLVLKDNVLDGSSWGLYLRFSHDAQIVENQIKNQAVTGILNFGSARTQIERNTVTNAKNHGIDVRHGTGPNVQVINNTVIGSKEGIYLMHSQGHTAANNELINCTISSISCYGSSNIEIYNNTMKKSRIGILLGGGYKNINVGENTFNLNNLPYPPTFVYFIAEGKSDFQSADSMMGTHSDSSENPVYTEYTEIPTPKDINVNYATILNPTGTTYKVPAGTSSADIQTIIANLNDGDTLEFEENAVYNDVSIYVDKNVKVIGNNATLIGYDSVDLANVPAKVTASTDENGYALSNPAVLYVLNNTGAVISGLNIIAQYPGYAPLSTVPPTSMEYKTAGIRTKDSINVTITNCKVDGASWGIYLEFSRGALVTNNEISNQFTTGILNFGTGNSILANNTITDAVNHGIDVRHGTGPNVTVFNNTISGSKEGIYLMHSKGHSVYGNTITDSSISGITCYGSGNEKVFDNSISGSRIGILLGGGYYNVTIGKNSYSLDSLPFPPTFVTYLAKVETTYDSASKAVGVYSDKYDTYIDASDVYKNPGEVEYKVKLTDSNGKPEAKQTVTFAIGDDTYTEITDSEGIATLALNLTEGKYDVAINYAGTDNFKAASENVTITVSSVKVPANNTAEAIQAAIDAAQEGDTIDLTAFDEYDVGNATIEVPVKGITIQGSGLTLIKGWGGPGNGIFHVSANDVTFKGIVFKDTNPNSVLTYYDDATKGANEVKGWGIHFQRAQNGVVDNCVFQDFNHGVRIQQQANNVTVMNSVFTGVTNYLRNDPTVNVEKGTKAIGVMGSQNPTIINNTFNGPMLDAISLASGCAGALVSGNTFNGNSYSIYFGGASTGGTLIDNNTFINCGYFKGLDNNGTEVEWEA
ncbi:MAG: right-handed parallel beta-helix repeat-containing protein, partial [Methanobrevibacter sp.]|nr:right-handed parallel beta-helix repeat-containing protein [Methanobrevibacter sp.]